MAQDPFAELGEALSSVKAQDPFDELGSALAEVEEVAPHDVGFMGRRKADLDFATQAVEGVFIDSMTSPVTGFEALLGKTGVFDRPVGLGGMIRASDAIAAGRDFYTRPSQETLESGVEAGFLNTTLPGGAASMASMLVPGAAALKFGAGARIAQRASMMTGSMMQAQSMYQAARASGADADTQTAAYVAGLGIGATELLPVNRVVSKVAKLGPKGTFARKLGLVLEGSGSEAVQEGLIQTPLEIAVAQHLLEYADKQTGREVLAQIFESGAAGAILGGSAALIFDAVGPSPEDIGTTPATKVEQDTLDKMDSASEAVGRPVVESTPEAAAEALKEQNDVPDAEVRILGQEVEGQEVSPDEDRLAGFLELLREERTDGPSIPEIALVDAGEKLGHKGVVSGGQIAIDANQTLDVLKSTLLHEVQHQSAAPGTPAFKETVKQAREYFPALAQAKVDRYVKNFVDENGHEPFQSVPEGPERDALMFDEGFAQGAEDFVPLLEGLLNDQEYLATPEAPGFLRTVLDWLRGVIGKLPKAQAKLKAEIDALVKTDLQEGAKPEEVLAFAKAILGVMQKPSAQAFKQAAEAVTLEDVIAVDFDSQVDLDVATAGPIDVDAMQAEVDAEREVKAKKKAPQKGSEEAQESKKKDTERVAAKKKRPKTVAKDLKDIGKAVEPKPEPKPEAKPTRSKRGLTAKEAALEAGEVDEFRFSVSPTEGEAVDFDKEGFAKEGLIDKYFFPRKLAQSFSEDDRLLYSDWSKSEIAHTGKVQHEAELLVKAIHTDFAKIVGGKINLKEAHDFLRHVHAPERNQTSIDDDKKLQAAIDKHAKAREKVQNWTRAKKLLAKYNEDVANGVKVRRAKPPEPGPKPVNPGPAPTEKPGGWGEEKKPSSGMRTSESKALVKEALAGPNGERYRKLRAWNRRAQAEVLNSRLRVGAISKELYDAIKGRGWVDYVSLRHTMKGKTGVSRSAGFGTRGDKIRKFKGRSSESDNVVLNLAADAATAVQERNAMLVGQEFLKLAEENPDPTIWTVVEDSLARVRMATQEEIDSGTADPARAVMREIWDARIERPEMAFPVRRDGKQFHIVFTPKYKAVVDALNNKDMKAVSNFFRIVGPATRFLGNMWTQWSPTFLLNNLLRDTPLALTGMELEHGASAALWVFRNQRKAIKGFRDFQKGNKTEWSGRIERYLEAGGEAGWFFGGDMESIQKDVEKAMAADEKKGNLEKGKAVLGYIEEVNRAVENGVRASAFTYLVEEKGLPVDEAVVYAKEMTVNFSMKGKWVESVGPAYLFLNAGIQGSRRMTQLATGSEIADPRWKRQAGQVLAKRAAIRMARYVLIFAMLDALYYAMSGEDDDGQNEWDAEAEFRKDKNFYVPMPGGKPFVVGKLPYGMNTPATLGRKISEVITGRATAMAAATDIAESAMGAFIPVSGIGLGDRAKPGADLGRMFAPTLADAAIDLMTNTKFTGSSIFMSPRPGERAPAPAWTRAYSDTPSGYVAASKFMSRITGGTDVRPGSVIGEAFKPEGLEHLVNSIGGSTLRDATGPFQAISHLINGNVGAAGRATPMLRSFMPPDVERKSFWVMREHAVEIDYTVEEHKDLLEKGLTEAAAEFKKQNKELLDLQDDLKELDKESRKLRRQITNAKGDAKRDLQEKALKMTQEFNRKAQKARTPQ